MKTFIRSLARHIYQTTHPLLGQLKLRRVQHLAYSGDAQFDIDAIAEQAIHEFVEASNESVALFTEDHGLLHFGENPNYLLIIDPIDGTRSAAAGLESCCVSIAAAPFSEESTISDVTHAMVIELKSGRSMYADIDSTELECEGYQETLPNLSSVANLNNMFWSIEFNGHPARLMIDAYEHLIDRSANPGGVFVFSSAVFSITRIITGQLDAYVDIGNRLLKDDQSLRERFEAVGNGKVLHLFPYDIAAAVFLAEKAGVVITDAYGQSLRSTRLCDVSAENQQSCIAASNRELHRQLLENIRWNSP